MGGVVPFNPLDKINLASSIERALASASLVQFCDLARFSGSGVYSIYYTGTFPAYDPLAKQNKEGIEIPIYVGKADSKGKRKGGFLDDGLIGETLWKRLNEHGNSLQLACNLNLADFCCRYLVVDDLWISLGESLLISKYSPVWNTLVDGFGNHDPGSGRYSGKRPRWDTLHPGRKWAEKLSPNPMTPEQISIEVLEYLSNLYPTVSKQSKDSYHYAIT